MIFDSALERVRRQKTYYALCCQFIILMVALVSFVVGSERRVRKAAVRKESSNKANTLSFQIDTYWCRSSSNKEVVLFRSSVVVDNSLDRKMGSGKLGQGIMLVVLEV